MSVETDAEGRRSYFAGRLACPSQSPIAAEKAARHVLLRAIIASNASNLGFGATCGENRGRESKRGGA